MAGYRPDISGWLDPTTAGILRRNLDAISTELSRAQRGSAVLPTTATGGSGSGGGGSHSGWFHFSEVSLATPAIGDIWWDGDHLNFQVSSAVRQQVGEEIFVRVQNKSGADIPNGSVVVIAEPQGNNPTIELADADTIGDDAVIGITTEDIDDYAFGRVTQIGVVNEIDTSGYAGGDRLWLSQTPGQMTNARPSNPARQIIVGVAQNSTNNGRILTTIREGDALFDGRSYVRKNGCWYSLFDAANTWSETQTFQRSVWDGVSVEVGSASYIDAGTPAAGRYGVRSLVYNRYSNSSSIGSASNLGILRTSVAASKIVTGNQVGLFYQAFRQGDGTTPDSGTVSTMSGLFVQFGHSKVGTDNPTTSAMSGLRLLPRNNGGTISTLKAISIEPMDITGGTTTDYWAVYQEDATAKNLFAGPITFSNAAMTWSGNPTHSGNHTWSGNVTFNGNATFGNATTDTITLTSRFVSDLLASTNNARALGSDALRWSAVHATEFYKAGVTLTSLLAGKEPVLGNPAADGYVLASTAAGVRSWYNIAGALALYLPLTGGTITGNLTLGDAAGDTVTVNGTTTIQSASTALKINPGNSSAGIQLYRNTTGTGSIGRQEYHANSSTSVDRIFARTQAVSVTATNGAEDGAYDIYVLVNGVLTERAYFDENGVKITNLSGTGTRVTVADSTGLLGTRLASSYITQTLTANAAIALDTELLRMTGTGFTGTLTTSLGNGRVISFRNSGTGNLTIACAGAETIDGVATLVIPVGGIAKICSVAAGLWETVP